ncbi:thioredoxin [Laccaria bicolor S238N-H82]|uniref:Thioredoxin n=1 Tax=Laccaria bicolor (strain S238N-H82 / ATCC MYA-4686) TaxID=486041 RepID=B0CS34_LACBS|nr:thioredoxin [Laccaria bicolor S238N-H82]EDR14784.1 thioredoxin [Laccaria bicolor S238N-H82]|eukprot:XP_001875343.1 thioredoxin [Laccaria bicolor S238N-H82]
MPSTTLRSLCRTFVSGSHPVRASKFSLRTFRSTPHRTLVYANADAKIFEQVTTPKDRIAVLVWPMSSTRAYYRESGLGLPFDLVKVDTESEHGLALGQKYQVTALPTVIAFRDGKPIDKFVGALREPDVKAFLEKL